MAKNSSFLYKCPKCNQTSKDAWCRSCAVYGDMIKEVFGKITDNFTILGLGKEKDIIIQDSEGNEYTIVASQLIPYLAGTSIGNLTIIEYQYGRRRRWMIKK